MSDRAYTTKQMGDAGEMLVAAELTLAGIPSLKVPDNWPHYDIVAQPPDNWYDPGAPRSPQKISVKTRTFAKSGHVVPYNSWDDFDWLAIVILPDEEGKFDRRQIFIVPRDIADIRSYFAVPREGRGFFVHRLINPAPPKIAVGEPVPAGGWGIADYRDNFGLLRFPQNPTARSRSHMPEKADEPIPRSDG